MKKLPLRVYYSEFETFPYCSMKIIEVLNNNGASYIIAIRFPTIPSAQLVELSYKRLRMKKLPLRVYYSEFETFPYCSMKIIEVLNNNGASYIIAIRFPTIQSAQLVELSYKRLRMKKLLLRVYYSEFETFPYCSIKITEVLNNNRASYIIVIRFPTIQSAQLVELTYKR